MEIINWPGLIGAMLLMVSVAAMCKPAMRRPPVTLWDDEPADSQDRAGSQPAAPPAQARE